MRERPILFNGEMVRAILDGRKTRTARPIISQPSNMDEWSGIAEFSDGRYGFQNAVGGDYFCPFGRPGDRLWVRESFQLRDVVYDDYCGGYEAGYPLDHIPKEKPESGVMVEYREQGADGPWRPSIHMPRWASRIMLEITDVRVERVQDITEEDAIKEGVSLLPYMIPGDHTPRLMEPTAIWHFRDIWNRAYAKRGYGWDVNPWAWVVLFKMIS